MKKINLFRGTLPYSKMTGCCKEYAIMLNIKNDFGIIYVTVKCLEYFRLSECLRGMTCFQEQCDSAYPTIKTT